tara:strand:- start:176 stop:883 length:708 start_codon:yes stop_codon:yes gene_type:complete
LKLNSKKIVVTGGTGRFCQILRNSKIGKKYYYPKKNELNILNIKSIEKYLKKIKPRILIHCAGLSRPMNIHDSKIDKSIDLNIIGTCNIVKICQKYNIKMIYFSTGYVYQGTKGNYKETDPVYPFNSYAWSKLGGECAVKLYKNSLILRFIMCEKPFIHKTAFYDVKTNFIFHDDVVKIIPKILNQKGVINVGGKIQSLYKFAKKYNKKIRKSSGIKFYPPNPSMSISKLKKIIS